MKGEYRMSGRILFVDEAVTNRIYLNAMLGAASYDPIEAQSAPELLHFAAHARPDLILLAAGLSEPDEFTLCRKLKADPATQDIPLVLLAYEQDPDARLAYLQAGADEVLPKPIEEPVLRARIRTILRNRAMHREFDERAATTAELGFAEAPTPFEAPLELVLADDPAFAGANWQSALTSLSSTRLRQVPPADLIGAAASGRRGPDLVLLPPELVASGGVATAIAELRSREVSRHAAIIVAHHPRDRAVAALALDLGANDLIEVASTREEISQRLAQQIDLKRKSDEMRAKLENGLQMAVTDPLTGLYNRRYAIPHLDRIATSAARLGKEYAVMVCDLDHFKQVNDRYGHAAGDAVLKKVAHRLKSNLRSIDLLARMGGEEFLLVMPETGMKAAHMAAERLRRIIGDQPIRLPSGLEIPVTASFGLAIGGKSSPDHMTETADHALLQAKAQGRNLVEVRRAA